MSDAAASGAEGASLTGKSRNGATPSAIALAKRLGLRHVTTDALSIRRRRRGRGWAYIRVDGRPIQGEVGARAVSKRDLEGPQRQLATEQPQRRRVLSILAPLLEGPPPRAGGEETAEVIGVSPATVKREWALAKAWLFRELS